METQTYTHTYICTPTYIYICNIETSINMRTSEKCYKISDINNIAKKGKK